MPKTDVTIRRAPRIWSFMITGAFVGIIVAAFITVATPVDPTVGVMPTFGFFALFAFAIGLILGGLVGVFLDRATKTSRGVAEITETKPRPTKARKPTN
jgi:ABC-type multidrug transport system permease subunit